MGEERKRIPGWATAEGTGRFAARFAPSLPGHFSEIHGLRLSSIGIGTYLGEPTTECDTRYADAVERAVELGVNVVDTAVNYRHQRSERSVGRALARLVASGKARRDEIFLATKGGFLTFDADEPPDPEAYFEQTLVGTGLLRAEEVVAGCHAIAPRFLEHQIEASRSNLGVETIDLYYLHNPETQLAEVTRDEFERRLKAAFAALEKAVSAGAIRAYGAATWNAFRAGVEARDVLSLADVLHAAEEVAGPNHHFRAVELPLNLAMPEALAARTQLMGTERVPFLQAARASALMVFSSASLLQGRLAAGLPDGIQKKLPGFRTDAQRSLQFVRSTPGITSALVGMSRREHVEENLAAARVPRLTREEYRAIFS
ncbi:MAG: aldo/keto reductase [Acidobacteria bacterium]|nr:MAG: aldo/keto reductase [Acidobacteriota bacterium]